MQDAKHATNTHISLVIVFLNEKYLRSVPLPRGAFFAKGPTSCHHWFKVFTTWVLRWKSRKDEGDCDGFLAELNFHLRNYVYSNSATYKKWW